MRANLEWIQLVYVKTNTSNINPCFMQGMCIWLLCEFCYFDTTLLIKGNWYFVIGISEIGTGILQLLCT